MRDYRHWTELEVNRLQLNYGKAPTALLAERLGRSVGSVHRKAYRMGLHGIPPGGPRPHGEGGQFGCDHPHASSGRCWSTQEVVTLEVRYGTTPVRRLAVELGRSVHAVRTKANRLGLIKREESAA